MGNYNEKRRTTMKRNILRTLKMVKMLPTKRLSQHGRKFTWNYTKDFQPPSHSAEVEYKIYGDETQKLDAKSDMTTAERN